MTTNIHVPGFPVMQVDFFGVLRQMGEAIPAWEPQPQIRKACDNCRHEDESGLHEPCGGCVCEDWEGEQPNGWEPKEGYA